MKNAKHTIFSSSRSRGFTLLEVMVALAIAAIGLGAISKSMITSVDIATKLKERTISTWVASNRIAELRINRQFTTSGGNTGQADMAGFEWRVVENFSATPDPNISRVDIEVFSPQADFPSARLTGYLARYQPAEK